MRRISMSKTPGDESASHVREIVGLLIVVKDVPVPVEQREMEVQTRTVVALEGLWHKGDGLVVPSRHILDDVLIHQQMVGHLDQLVKLQVDFGLTSRSDLVVLTLNI